MKKTKTVSNKQPSTSATTTANGSPGQQLQSIANSAAAKPSLVSSLTVTKYETKKRQERMERFGATPSSNLHKHKQPTRGDTTGTSDDHEEDMVGPYYDIIGRNMEIEKSYLRLTTYPKCEDVRPLPILIKALDHVKRKYQQNDDFDWCNDQLKSIRQDITVQKSHIPSNHTLLLDVYQTHARILLEHGQLSEFNQCLSNVLQIYDALQNDNDRNKFKQNSIVDANGIRSKSTTTTCSVKKAEGEFRAYSILYSLVQSKTTFLDLNIALRRRLQQHQMFMQQEEPQKTRSKPNNKKSKKRRRPSNIITDTSSDAVSSKQNGNNNSLGMMNDISEEEQHAWDVVHSMYNGQYTKFFSLYDTAAHMSPYILDFLLHRVRLHSYHAIIASYRPSISILYIQQSLHFDTLDEVHHFLQQRGTVFVPSTSPEDGHPANSIEHLVIDCRQSQQVLMNQNTGTT